MEDLYQNTLKKFSHKCLILTNANKGAPELYPAREITKLRNEAKKLIRPSEQISYILKIYQPLTQQFS